MGWTQVSNHISEGPPESIIFFFFYYEIQLFKKFYNVRPLGVEPDLVTDCCSRLFQLLDPGFPPLPLLPFLSCLLTPLSRRSLRASSCPWSTIVGSLRTSPALEVWMLPCTAPNHAPVAPTSAQHSHQCLHLVVDMQSHS